MFQALLVSWFHRNLLTAALQRKPLAEVAVGVQNRLLFMSGRLWSLQRYLLEGDSRSLLATQAPGSQQDGFYKGA